jgi:hypothetical protein
MYISQESKEDVEKRLLNVIRDSQLHIFEQPYFFQEFPLTAFSSLNSEALALVRDENVWSQLVPYDASLQNKAETFFVLSFHFPENIDNSGFVGWLATYFKECLGTGVFVVCGQNSQAGGIFDYWGFPYALKSQALEALHHLMK